MSELKNNEEQADFLDAVSGASGITREYIEGLTARAEAEQLRRGMSRDEYFAHCLASINRRADLENKDEQ